MTNARSGYTLPVFACAAAIAALETLENRRSPAQITLDLINPAERVTIAIEQAARLSEISALAICRSDPGDNLDLTRHTPVWALVSYQAGPQRLQLEGGEGIGIQSDGEAAIYQYAQALFQANLESWLVAEQTLTVRIILPEGRQLAQRTSNAAFGVVEGLSLLGTSGIAQPLSAPQQLEDFQRELRQKAEGCDGLVFCLGENGLDLAQKWGIDPKKLIKTANWLGPMLVTAAIAKVPAILLLGYHGKLIKLAGGIFHTHHHLADARLEILTALAAYVGLPIAALQTLMNCSTTEAALKQLRAWDTEQQTDWVNILYQAIAARIDRRTQDYIFNHTERSLPVGSLLFDGDRQPLVLSDQGKAFARNLGLKVY